MQIKGEIVTLRCATCNKVQQPTSSQAVRLFAREHWFHAGYTILVDISEPTELACDLVDVQTSRVRNI